MNKSIARLISVEMSCLWVVEALIAFFLIRGLLVSGLAEGGAGSAALRASLTAAAAALAVATGGISLALGLYRPEICLETRRLLLNTMVAGGLAFPVIWLASLVIGIDARLLFGHGALSPAEALLLWIACLFLTRLALRAAIALGLFVRRIVIVGADDGAARLARAIGDRRRGFFEVVRTLPAAAGGLDALWLRERRIWAVVVTSDDDALRMRDALLQCKTQGVRVFRGVEFWESELRRVDIDRIGAEWLLFSEALREGWLGRGIGRSADIVVSVALLVFTLPVMLATALAIRLDSPGPILYRQERVGLHGRVFTLRKFRSMRVDAEAHGPVWAAQRDSRVTRVGAVIRLVRIDELPQLINVLRGEMSFIGPRPERPHFVEHLSQAIPFYRDRAFVKPGVTGWAQVNYPYGSSVEDARMKLSYDLYYVKNRSPLLNLFILLSTVRVVLFQEGAR